MECRGYVVRRGLGARSDQALTRASRQGRSGGAESVCRQAVLGWIIERYGGDPSQIWDMMVSMDKAGRDLHKRTAVSQWDAN